MRGGLVYVDRLVRERPDVRGIVSATRGNHGQSLAFAGRAAGVAVTIVVPHGNSPDKNAAMRAFGAELIEHGVDFQAAREHSVVLAEQRGLEAVPSFHRDLVHGRVHLRARVVRRRRARSTWSTCPWEWGRASSAS